MNKDIYDLKLYEVLKLDDTVKIVRMPGGWIQHTLHKYGGKTINVTSVFVPFSNEFQKY